MAGLMSCGDGTWLMLMPLLLIGGFAFLISRAYAAKGSDRFVNQPRVVIQ